MVINGHVHNGVIVLDGGVALPEGTSVRVAPTLPPPVQGRQPIPFPLIRSAHPGSLKITEEQIAEILGEDDVPA